MFEGQLLKPAGSDTSSAGRRPDEPQAIAGFVTVKVLKDPVPAGFLELYTRELAITHRLSAENGVLRYHDVDVIGNRYCVVTENFAHPSLQRLFNERRRLGYSAVLGVLRALAKVLEAAQMEGLAERHVRYDDVLVDPVSGETRIAKLSIPRSLAVAGASPSRRASAGVTRDLFFIGCTLYRTIVLEYPFPRAHAGESVAAEKLETALKAHYSEVGPQEVSRLLLFFNRCTTSEMANRFTTYDEVVKEIGNLECLNADIMQSRRQLEERTKRRRRMGMLQTAFDTVAALRGELRAPLDEVPSPGTIGARRAASLARERPQEPAGAVALKVTAQPLAPKPGPGAPAPAAPAAAVQATAETRDLSTQEPPKTDCAATPRPQEIRALLWDRVRRADGGLVAWDNPAVTKVMLSGSILLFVGMLLWLLFGH